jgi:hypothetical protein
MAAANQFQCDFPAGHCVIWWMGIREDLRPTFEQSVAALFFGDIIKRWFPEHLDLDERSTYGGMKMPLSSQLLSEAMRRPDFAKYFVSGRENYNLYNYKLFVGILSIADQRHVSRMAPRRALLRGEATKGSHHPHRPRGISLLADHERQIDRRMRARARFDAERRSDHQLDDGKTTLRYWCLNKF